MTETQELNWMKKTWDCDLSEEDKALFRQYIEPSRNKTYRKEAKRIIHELNKKTNRRYRPTETNLRLIISRYKEGFTTQEMLAVIAIQCREWIGTDQEMYLRPATLFNATKFNQYVGKVGTYKEKT